MQTQIVKAQGAAGILSMVQSGMPQTGSDSFQKVLCKLVQQTPGSQARQAEPVKADPAAKAGTVKAEPAANVGQTAGQSIAGANKAAGTVENSEKAAQADGMGAEEVSGQEALAGTKDTQETAEDTKTTESVTYAETVATLLAQVTQLVAEVLDMTPEELTNTMELLGMTPADLLSAEPLQQLFLAVQPDSDVASLLTDANLLAGLQELTGTVEELAAEAGVLPEEAKKLMENPEFVKLLGQEIMKPERPVEVLDGTEPAVTVKAQEPEEEKQETDAKPVLSEEGPVQQPEKKETELEFRGDGAKDTEPGTGRAAAKVRNTEDMEFAAKANPAEQFLNRLEEAAKQVDEVSGWTDIAAQIREIAEQILDRIKVTVTSSTTSLEIQLTPEHLGKVNLTVSQENGVMKASFVTENQISKEAIESNLVQFKEMLNEQGIKVDSIEVMVSDFSFDKGGQAAQNGQEESGKHGKRQFSFEEPEETNTDRLGRHFIEEGESTVSYIA